MTPQEIQRTIDFILRVQADSVIRWQRAQEEHIEIRRELKALSRSQQKHERSQQKYERAQQKYEKQLRALKQSYVGTSKRYEGMRDILRILTRLLGTQSKRVDRLEQHA